MSIDDLAAMMQRGLEDTKEALGTEIRESNKELHGEVGELRSEMGELRTVLLEAHNDLRTKVVEFIDVASTNRRLIEDLARKLEHTEQRVSALERQKKA